MSFPKPDTEYLNCLKEWVERERKRVGNKSKLATLVGVSRPAIYDWENTKVEQFIDEASRQKIFAYCKTYNRQPPYCLVEIASDSELEALMQTEVDLAKVARAIAIGINRLKNEFEPPT
ncbi:MAG TPA: helix-turn-helix transcriptional regulator [Allocoleopsis sp.]